MSEWPFSKIMMKAKSAEASKGSQLALGALVPWIKDQVSGLLQQPGVVMNVGKELMNIQAILHAMEAQLNDAGAIRLTKAEDIIFELEDVLFKNIQPNREADGEVKARRLLVALLEKVCSSTLTPSLTSCLDYHLPEPSDHFASKIKEINGKLTLYKQAYFRFLGNPKDDDCYKQFPNLLSTSSLGDTKLYGRKSDAESLLEHFFLPCKDNGVKVIAIVGCGGIGKTALAQLLYNKDEVTKHFDKLRAWLCVSSSFDERRLAETLLGSSTLHDVEDLELEPLFQLVQDKFSRKVFLCVFDDVMIEDYSKWIRFMSLLRNGAKGSIILVTTRSERVPGVIQADHTLRLKPLLNSDCWRIVKGIALFGRDKFHKEVKKLRWKLAQKCGGSPLVAESFGYLLLNKDTAEEWQSVLEMEIWEMKVVAKELFRHFYFDYDELSPQLKLCILYCADFPKGTVLNVDQIIWLWMAQGYLGDPSLIADNRSLEMKGIEYFNYLVNRSYFQELVKGSIHKDKITSCKVHEWFHEFIRYKARGYVYKKKSSAPAAPTSRKERAFHTKLDSRVPGDWFGDLFRHWKDMRALVLSSCQLEELPSEVKCLTHLQYLDLSKNPIKKLPETICSLYSLVFLDLRFCYLLSCLPEQIGALKELKHLRIDYTTDELHNLPEGFKKLTLMKTLDVLRAGGRYKDVIEKLSGLNDLEDIRIAVHGEVQFLDANLGRKIHLKNLELCFVGDGRNQEKTSSIKELMPPPNLQMLKFEDYPGLELPMWILTKNLRRLSLRSAINISSLPALWTLPVLEFLWLYDIPNIKHMGREFFGLPKAVSFKDEDQKMSSPTSDSYPSSDEDVEIPVQAQDPPVTAFCSLKTLRIEYLESWETWEDLNDDDNVEKISVMQSLEELIVASCPKLKALPNRILGNIPRLKVSKAGH